MTSDSGLSGLVVQTLRVDRAGDLWVGARDGLYRVHRNAVTRFTRC